jgi:hypothetical protein
MFLQEEEIEIAIQIELIIDFRELEGFILHARSGNRKR